MTLIYTDQNMHKTNEVSPRLLRADPDPPKQCEFVLSVFISGRVYYIARKFLSRSLPESVSTLSG
jgi:hypothetical protein